MVDTCLLLDVGTDDPRFFSRTERLLNEKATDGLVICPVTFVELGPSFKGQCVLLEEFLDNLSIAHDEDWLWEDTKCAYAAWAAHVHKRRGGLSMKRPVADVLIGAFACRFDGLLTRNRADFAGLLPVLKIVEP